MYLAIAALAGAGGTVALRTEAFLLIALVFLGFNAAWLLLFEQPQEAAAAAANLDPPPVPAALAARSPVALTALSEFSQRSAHALPVLRCR